MTQKAPSLLPVERLYIILYISTVHLSHQVSSRDSDISSMAARRSALARQITDLNTGTGPIVDCCAIALFSKCGTVQRSQK